MKKVSLKVADLDRAEVWTVEGLGTPDNPHLIQQALVLAGVILCGYCTPGMDMTTKVLVDGNPYPDEGEIKKAFARDLCPLFQKACLLLPSLQESIFLTSKRHPFDMKVKLAADEEGRLTTFVNGDGSNTIQSPSMGKGSWPRTALRWASSPTPVWNGRFDKIRRY